MKIPFERTISSAYRFTFTNILSIIGIGWFPYLLFGALAAAVLYNFGPQLLEMFNTMGGKPDPSKIRGFLTALFSAEAILIPAVLAISAMVTVGLMRKALGQHPGPVFVFFSLGSQVWRLIGSYFLVMLLGIGMIIAVAGGVALIWFALDKVAKPAEVPITVVLVIAAYIWFIYAIVRVYFFLPAVVVAENHIGIRRSWHLGGGNFWRIVGIWLIVTIPIGLAAQTIETSILQMAGGSMMLQPGATPDEIKHFIPAMLDALRRVWPYLAVVYLFHVVIAAGLTAGAIANAYNLVTGGDDIAPPPAKVPA